MSLKFDIVVLGGGAFGSTLASVLAENQRRVALWVRDADLCNEINETKQNGRYLKGFPLPKLLVASTDLVKLVQSSRVLLVAIPLQSMRAVLREIAPYLSAEQILVHASKGIELGTHVRGSEIIRQETLVRKLGVISGPNLAKEMMRGQPSGALVASKFGEVCQVMQDLYRGSTLRLYRSNDVEGAEIAGAFKNIIAFLVGIATGREYLDNTKALLVTRGLIEMIRFGLACGARERTFLGLAGVGDLMATCYSPSSRNRQVGELVGKGSNWREVLPNFGGVVEGISTTKAVQEQAAELGLDLPLVRGLYQILYEDFGLDEVIGQLMARPTDEEICEYTPSEYLKSDR